jgi:hypothetical protein
MNSGTTQLILMSSAVVCLSANALAQTTTTLVDNESVRIVRSVQQPHERQNWPKQEFEALVVYLQAGTQEVTFAGGSKSPLRFSAGDIRWLPVSGAYTTEITSSEPVTQVVIFIRKPESEGGPNVKKFTPTRLDPLIAVPDQYSLILENKRVRVMNVKSAPGQTAKLHEHLLSRAVVYLTDMKAKVEDANGPTRIPTHRAGDVSWNPPARHVETNLLDTPFEAVVVEIK